MKRSQSTIPGDGPAQGPRLYRTLADRYPLLTPVSSYSKTGHEVFLGLRLEGSREDGSR